MQLVTLLRSHDPPFCFLVTLLQVPGTRLDSVSSGLVSRSLIGWYPHTVDFLDRRLVDEEHVY